MPKIMVINVTHSEESRVGVIKDGVLEAFEIEALSREHLKGNIYKGVVRRIHPALEAAFVDIGAERDAFLPLDEICFRNLPHPPPPGNGERRRRRVRDLLRPGEELLVQIVKEQFANKPPTLTTFYSLPGRYLVLLPGSDDAGISRRIEGDDRLRIRKLISELEPPEGFGIIVRTAAGFDQDAGELKRDLAYLQRLWDSVQQAAENRRAPALVYREHDIVLRTIRDYFTPDIDEIYIDHEEVYQRARDFLHNVMPGKEAVLRLYTSEQPIFSAFGIESQIESIFKRRVPLRSGGSIVIDTTEALTAIDVNSGGSVRSASPEETAFRTNLEACPEIARQLRLRDIGGIIVVDFIDMRETEHIHEVERTLREAMRVDKARHEIGRISRLGLLEISRQRLRPAAMASTYTSCPMCEGHGAIRTTESAALVALRKLHNRVALGDVAAARVSLPPEVALYLLNQKRDDLAQLEERYKTRIHVNLNDRLMPHQMELDVRVRHDAEPQDLRPAPGTVAEGVSFAGEGNGRPADAHGGTVGEANGGKKRRRRRGGRRARARRAAVAIGQALAVIGTSSPVTSSEAAPRAVEPEVGGDQSAPSVVEADPDGGSAHVEAAGAVPNEEGRDVSPARAPGRSGRRRRGGRRQRARAAQPAAISEAGAAESVPGAAGGAADPEASAVLSDIVPAATLPVGPDKDPKTRTRRSAAGRRPAAKTAATNQSEVSSDADASAAAGSRPRKRAAKTTSAAARTDNEPRSSRGRRRVESSPSSPEAAG